MTDKAAIRAKAEALHARFAAEGAEVFETDILQPAGDLLDLYGEDIRARAFVTHDPLRGEMMLRPDFTLPLVQQHMAEGRGEARYTYSGKIFRRQEDDPSRAVEYQQVGFEVFSGATPADADAEVFALFLNVLRPYDLRFAMGDIGLLIAAVSGLGTTEDRKAALRHHIWRPGRFRKLLARFGQPAALRNPVTATGAEIGLRTRAEVDTRLAALVHEQTVPPLSADEIALLDELLSVKGGASDAVARLQDIEVDLPSIRSAVDGLRARFDAFDAQGIDVEALSFEASYGRTTLEYYDGFVFGFHAEARPDLPPVATGGRYDALTSAVGGGVGVPAVGGVVRPGLLVDLEGGA